MAQFIHPATSYELLDLSAFDGSYEDIERVLGNNQDIAANWTMLGVEQLGSDQKRVIVIERSHLGVGYIVGDGIHFGRAVVASEKEVKDIIQDYGLHWE